MKAFCKETPLSAAQTPVKGAPIELLGIELTPIELIVVFVKFTPAFPVVVPIRLIVLPLGATRLISASPS